MIRTSPIHFRFMLPDPACIDAVVGVIKNAGGHIRQSGAFVPAKPHVFFFDPDECDVGVT
jgi:hypothetical protein